MASIAAVHMEDLRVQHDRLLRYVAQLRSPLPPHKARQIVDDLICYFDIHASDEEQFMLLHGYPHVEEHRKEHEEVRQILAGLRELLDTPQIPELAGSAGVRMMLHLDTADRMYVDYFRAAGVLPHGTTLCSFGR